MASHRYVVVGVVPHQRSDVARTALRFAERFDAELVCAQVLSGNYVVEERPDGSVRSLPIDPDAEDFNDGTFDPELRAELQQVLGSARWSTRTLAGEPALALARLAEVLDAEMIVVGTRSRESRRESLLTGSVAVRLAHRQHRPVVVVPLAPVAVGQPEVWEAW